MIASLSSLLTEPVVHASLGMDDPVYFYPEHAPDGAWNDGLLCTYQVKCTEPFRSLLVSVFPFPDLDWCTLMREVLMFECAVWKRWWGMQRSLPRTHKTVSDFPMLLRPLDEVIHPIEVELQTQSETIHLPGMVRPLIEWPSLQEHPMIPSERAQLWESQLAGQIEHLWPEEEPTSKRRPGVRIDDFRPWKVLSNGQRMVCTTWRAFHKDYHLVQLEPGLRLELCAQGDRRWLKRKQEQKR